MSSRVAGCTAVFAEATTFFSVMTGASSTMISASIISASSTSSSGSGCFTSAFSGSTSGVRVSSSSIERTTSSSSGSETDFLGAILEASPGRPTSSLVSPDSSNRSTRSLFFPEVGKSLRMHSAFSFATVNVDATSSLMLEPQPVPDAYPFQGWRSMHGLSAEFCPCAIRSSTFMGYIGPIFVLDVDRLVIGAISEFLEEVSIFCRFVGWFTNDF